MLSRKNLLWIALITALNQPVIGEGVVTITALDSHSQYVSEVVVREAYNRIGLKIKIIYLPGKRSLHTANRGKSKGELSRFKGFDKKYNNLIRVPIAVNVLQGVAVSSKFSVTKIDSWESLKPLKLGIRLGVVFSDAGTKGMNRLIVNKNDQLLKLLMAQRVEAIVLSRVNALVLLHQSSQRNNYKISSPLFNEPMFHYVHKNNAHIVPQLTQTLEEMEKDGTVEKLRLQALEKFLKAS